MVETGSKNVFAELFEYRTVSRNKLILALIITIIVMAVEVIGGLLTNSIALISEAGHLFTHVLAIAISLAAMFIARRPPDNHRTFGLYRAEILAAFINGIFLLLIVAVIVYEAILRIMDPREVNAVQMLIVAFIGLAVNVASIIILRGGHKASLNIRSVFYHMVADAASSVGIIIAAVIIYYSGWNLIDPIVSLGISAIIIYWAIGILRASTRILLEMAPDGLNVSIIRDDLIKNFKEIDVMDNMHLWSITTGMLVFSAHIRIKSSSKDLKHAILISKITKYLAKKYNIIECTIQAV